MRRYIPESVKRRARARRKEGYSIGQICRELGVSKSTVHEWTKTMEGAERYARLGKERWIKEIQPLGAQRSHKRRLERLQKIDIENQQEISQLRKTPELLKTMVAMLYWAEGSKSRGMLQFANTDPKLLLLFITLLRESFVLDESKFRIRLNLHWYHKEQETKLYWSRLLRIPIRQFQKTYRKRRSKKRRFRKNFGGICFLRYNSEHLRERVLRYGYALGEKIAGETDVPVA
jgi:transposase-like protein